MLNKPLEMGVCFHRGAAFGELGGASRGFEGREEFLYLGEFFMGNLRGTWFVSNVSVLIFLCTIW